MSGVELNVPSIARWDIRITAGGMATSSSTSLAKIWQRTSIVLDAISRSLTRRHSGSPGGPYPALTFVTKEIAEEIFEVSRRRSIPDSVRAGRSHIVPYRRGEDFRTRHARRLSANLEREDEVRRWCEQRRLTLRITNEGHHWQITDGGFLAEWWPSSAKLVIGKHWQKGIHCHDYKQVLKVIDDAYRQRRVDWPA